MPWWYDSVVEFSIFEREALIRIHAKMAAEQKGEAFADRRADNSDMRGPDRRAV